MHRFIGALTTKGELVAAQAGDEGLGHPMPERRLAAEPLALRQQPRRRVILVVVPVSSRKTSRCGSSRIRGWRVVVHSSRAALMSGRSCSLASRVFFEALAVADEPARQ